MYPKLSCFALPDVEKDKNATWSNAIRRNHLLCQSANMPSSTGFPYRHIRHGRGSPLMQIFRCVHASLWEDLSVCPFRLSVGNALFSKSQLGEKMVGNGWENSVNAPNSSNVILNCPKMSQNVPICPKMSNSDSFGLVFSVKVWQKEEKSKIWEILTKVHFLV